MSMYLTLRFLHVNTILSSDLSAPCNQSTDTYSTGCWIYTEVSYTCVYKSAVWILQTAIQWPLEILVNFASMTYLLIRDVHKFISSHLCNQLSDERF